MPVNSGQIKNQIKSPAVDQRRVQDEPADERFEQLIAETDWIEMTRRLLLFANSRLARYGLQDGDKTPHDYVVAAVSATLEGQLFPAVPRDTLFAFLARVVDSLISHDADPAMITRTIKPAVGSSRVSPEEARAAARLVYRDEKTGRFVIFDGERSDRAHDRAKKRVGVRSHLRDVAKRAEGSSRHPSTPRANRKKDRR